MLCLRAIAGLFVTALALACASPEPLIEGYMDVGATLDMQHGDSSNRLDMGTDVHTPDQAMRDDFGENMFVDAEIVEADGSVASLQAFTASEADVRIERDCGGCHTSGGTGSSRRLGWDNMSYQLVYFSVKDPWIASSSRMPLNGEYWSSDDIERLRLLYLAETEE